MTDTTTVELIKLAAASATGYAWQWARAPKNVPNWVSYGAFAVVVFVATVWVVPNAATQDWRLTALTGWNLFTSARGTASMSSEAGIAKPTNSL